MTRAKTGQGYNFAGAKAKALKARLKALREEQRRTGRLSLFDAKREDGDETAAGR